MAKITSPPTKGHRVPAYIRKPQILALQAMGMTQVDIAKRFGVSRDTIAEDLKDLKPANDQIKSLLSGVANELRRLLTPEQIASRLAELVMNAKNEAVSQGAIHDVFEYCGEMTEKERNRNKLNSQPEQQPMFVLPPGCNVAVTFNQQNNTIGSESASLHNVPTVTDHKPTTIDSDAATVSPHDIEDTP